MELAELALLDGLASLSRGAAARRAHLRSGL